METQKTAALPYLREAAELMKQRARGPVPLAFVRTYGCQQNVADGEKIKGILAEMGFDFTQRPDDADFVLFNTCAVREHAEDRVFGNVGALKHHKRRHPGMLIAVCGCMTEQESSAEKLREHFPYVDIVFGTHAIHRLPEMMFQAAAGNTRVFVRGGEEDFIREELPTRRDSDFRAWVTVMSGCDNFCSYCIVPYVRGREKSRPMEAIVREVEELVRAGYKEITLLGQNVNSYGKGLEEGTDFPTLLERLDAIQGDFRLRFMTSHPKDASKRLFDVMAASRHIPHSIHLPFQSGNDRVLGAMNRRYDRERYLSLIDYARWVMPDISFTSDVIVGFPGESYEEFEDTVSLVRQVRFTNLFTFIYSPRTGTRAAGLPDPVPHEEKARWMKELLAAQLEVAGEIGQAQLGSQERVLVEEYRPESGLLAGRMASGLVVLFAGKPSLVGQFCRVRVEDAKVLQLSGSLVG